MRTFFQELKRRRVYRVALAYVIGASATVQVVGTVLPAFHAPDGVFQILVLLLALGFPAALIIGWMFEVSSGGLRKTVVLGAAQSADHRRVAMLGLTGLLLAALALSGYWIWRPWSKQPLTSGAGELRLAGTAAAPPIPQKSIAVIPFGNFSDDKQNAYFTEGVQDEIITDLSKVADLKVISRTSVMQYRPGAERNLREIGKTLGVAFILEGSVRRDGHRVRVSAQLIDTRTDTHVWADQYDRDLSDLFALQSDLAETIVSQLRSKLSPEEKAAMEDQPTSDSVAHDFYLRANTLLSGPLFDATNLFEAVELLEKAVARDPNYFLAYCRLAGAHDQIYLYGPDHTAARLALADAAIKAAQRLRPDAGETHLALAEHLYCGFLAYDEARRELEIARRSLPNEPRIFELAGFIDRRQGRWEASTRNLERAVEFDPHPSNPYNLRQLALSYQLLRRYEDAARLLDRALSVEPNDTGLRVARAGIALQERADSHPLHTAIETTVTDNPEAAPGHADEWLFLALCERDQAAAARALAAMAAAQGYNNEGVFFPHAWCRGIVARAGGDAATARVAFASAREEIERKLRDEPDQSQSLCVLGMIDAALGRKEEAIREAQRAVELLPLDKDSINGALAIEYLAVTYAWTGEMDKAIEQLKHAVAIPSDVSYGQLRLHPFWDALRGDPRFEKIVASLAPAAAKPK